MAATKNSAATLLAAGRTRLELLGNEIREEKLHALRLLFLSQIFAFCLMVGTILAVALLIVVFWDHRVLLLGGFVASFFVVGGFAYVALRRSLHSDRRLFSASIAELGEDLRQLKGAARNESATD